MGVEANCDAISGVFWPKFQPGVAGSDDLGFSVRGGDLFSGERFA